jgi:exopolysaccharide biosynthesis polyprenyl glycosylphosphotransferase
MLRQFNRSLTAWLLLSDAALTVLALHFARCLRVWLPYGAPLVKGLDFTPWLYVLASLTWVLVFVSLSYYRSEQFLHGWHGLSRLLTAVGLATLVLSGTLYFVFRELSRLLFVYFFVIDVVFLFTSRLALRLILESTSRDWLARPQRVLVIGAGKTGQDIAERLVEYRWAGIHLVGFLDDDLAGKNEAVLGKIDEAERVVQQHAVDEIIIAMPLHEHSRLAELVFRLQQLAVNVRVVPDVLDLAFLRASVEDLAGIPLIGLKEPVLDSVDRLVKRTFDLVVGTVTLVLLAPLMAVIAIAIKLDSPGPVIYRPRRAGENGRPFWMLKFRSMVVGADAHENDLVVCTEQGDVLLKRPDDPRITRVGRVLRQFSLDELPQLINVLKGDMSLVGPRPELPSLVERYEPWQRKRFAMPQGMTGWWQISGRMDRPGYQRVEDDLYYILNYSILLDIRILFKTIVAVLNRRGAY